MDVLRIERLCCRPWGARLLDGIDLRLARGEIHAVLGANGAGKSTLLRCISGELAASGGRVRLLGRDIAAWPARQRAERLALLPQHSQLSFPFTAREVVALGRIPHRDGHARDSAVIDAAMRATDVLDMGGRIYTRLSGGEKRRVQLARVFAQIWPDGRQPALLLLDEPGDGLDLSHRRLLAEWLRALASQGVSVVLVEHDCNAAASLADRISVLHQGKIHRQGEPRAVLTAELFEQVFACPVRIIPHPARDFPLVVVQ